MSQRLKAIYEVVAEIVWRGFGIFLYIIGGAAGSGALLTGNPLMGVLISFTTLMLGIIGAVGYAIAVTGKAAKATVETAARDAIQKFEANKKD